MAQRLNQKQKNFCVYYVSGETTIGNGAQSYALAYRYDLTQPGKYLSAKSNAHKLLSKPEVNEYIDSLLQDQQVDDRLVERHMWLLITQNNDLNVKRQAIADYLRLGNRMAKNGNKRGGVHDSLQIAFDSLQELQDSVDPEIEAQVEELYDAAEQRWEDIRAGKVPYPST